jgi:hypothetical protein
MLIATRILKLRELSEVVDIAVRIFAPERRGDAWFCRFEIDWPEGRQEADAWGADSVQAIVLALQMIGANIYSSSYHKSGKLMHEAPGRGYGFPVPASIRDLREGDDALYDA